MTPTAARTTSSSDPRPARVSPTAALAAAAARLAAVSETPRLDAELLMAHALGTTREGLLLGRSPDTVPAGFEALVARRLDHEPVAYIVGRREFWTIDIVVGPGTLVPRPDSETLIDAALAHFRGTAGPASILDLGTGSGALLLAALAEWPRANGLGVDVSSAALTYAAANADRLGLTDRARILRGSWAGDGRTYDLVLCNPPYIAEGVALPRAVADHEPHEALFAGPDGLACHRAIAPLLAGQLGPGGVACIEIGADQGERAAALFQAEGLSVGLRRDLAGRDRCLVITCA